MAFGYEYLMVYLPEFNPESFLLFVHNPAGIIQNAETTQRRHGESGWPAAMADGARCHRGRREALFAEDAHTVSGEDGNKE